MKQSRLLLGTILCFASASCQSRGNSTTLDAVYKLRTGMSEEQAQAVVGKGKRSEFHHQGVHLIQYKYRVIRDDLKQSDFPSEDWDAIKNQEVILNFSPDGKFKKACGLYPEHCITDGVAESSGAAADEGDSEVDEEE